MKRGINLVRGHLFVACMTLLSAMFFAVTNAYGATYSYTDIPGSPIAIDSATTCTAPITRNIVVSDNFTISDLDVGFIASHVWRADVEVTLTAPDATSVQIIAGVGGDIDNYNVLMDSASASSLADGINHNTAAAPYEYTRAPSNSLGAFNGKSANGTWVLEVCDNWPSADDGTYIRSELIFTDTGGGGGGFAGTSTTPASGTVLNSYHKVTSLSGTSVTVDTSAGISAGDRGVLIQMKGATIDTSDTASHGDISAYNSAGRFEYVDVVNVVGTTLVLDSAPTVSFQTSGYVQFVRVPVYNGTTLSGTISALPWDGDKGGVVAIDDIGTLTLSGDINVTGLGFAGGALATTTPYDSCASDQNNYTGAVQAGTGNKGEGITAPNTSHAARRGHKANGGGGGNITDAGGGGGANYGFGGLGGRELDLCDDTGHYGGLGGQPLDYTSNNRLFFGGGGGSGSEISQAATGGDRSGGGLILLRAKAIDGTGGRLISNGLSALQDNDNGADGGAAAGAIAVSVHDSVTGLPIAQGDGGDGGNEANSSYAHGTGGGGGGGALLLNGPVCADFNFAFDGGEAGVSTLGSAVSDPNWGALDGGPGACMSSFSELPLVPIPGADDYSDAPASYGDATHTVTTGIQLGAAIDADSGSLASADATGDDADASDDEDGVSAFPTLTVGDSSYTLPAANITAIGTGTLHGWIDFDNSGGFGTSEYTSVSVTSGALSGDMVWSSLPALTAGNSFARFRFTSDSSVTSSTPASAASDGEVEDYQISIVNPTGAINCGTDTDSGYATGGTGNYIDEIFWLDWTCGATSQFVTGSTYTKSWDLGNGIIVTTTLSNITADMEPYNTGTYVGDELDNLYSGINPIGLITVNDSQDPNYDISFSATLNGTSIPVDVVMADAESTDAINENWTLTTDGTPWQPIEASGVLQARFSNGAQTLYMSEEANAGGGTLLSLTESVSTINVTMNSGGKQAGAYGVIFEFDYGDANGITSGGHFAPVSATGGSQPTTLTSVTSLTMATLAYGTDLHLGTNAPDTENSDQGNVNADGDDADATDDEDGVSAFPTLTVGDSSYTIPAANVSATGTGTLHAWIDFDGSGVFESGEHASVGVASGTVLGDLSWSSLPGMSAGTTYTRFRLTSDSNITSATPALAAIDGEIEDYSLTINSQPINFKTPLACPAGIGGAYATWNSTGTSGTGRYLPSLGIPSSPDFTWAATGNISSIVVSSSEVFDTTTDLEAIYGEADAASNLNIRVSGNATTGGSPIVSTVVNTITFDSNTPADEFAFAVTDIDVDQIRFRAKDSAGLDVPVATIASWIVETFDSNPTSSGVNSVHWDPAEAALVGAGLSDPQQTTWHENTHSGSLTDEEAPGAWFQPDIALSSLIVEFEPLGSTNAPSHHIYLASCVTAGDQSDAPSTYGSAAHTVTGGLQLGANIDVDLTSTVSVDASGDDTSNSDDEDGVSALPQLYDNATTYTVPAANVTATGTGTLHAWIDFNRDGTFESTEHSSVTVAGGILSGDLLWNSLPAMTPGGSFARFRFTSDPTITSADMVGPAANGEVEDYPLTILDSTTLPPSCPAGYTLTSSTGYVTTNAGVSGVDFVTNAYGAISTQGTTASSSNSAELNDTSDVVDLDLGVLAAENSTLTISLTQDSGAAGNQTVVEIFVSDDDVSYTSIGTYGSGGTIGSSPSRGNLHYQNVTASSGGVRYVRFVNQNADDLWLDGIEYTQICIGNAALTGSKTVEVWDPTAAGLYAVPGNDVIYSISGTNTGEGATDTDTIVLIDPIPSDVEFYNGDIDDGGPETDPVSFTQTAGAGLTFNYATDVAYSDAGSPPANFAACTYTPAAGYDPSVSYICINPKGALAGGDPDPSFTISFRARIK